MTSYVIVKEGIPIGFFPDRQDATEALQYTNGMIPKLVII